MSIKSTLYRKIRRLPALVRRDIRRLPFPLENEGISYRLFDDRDSIEELTLLINKAYSIYTSAGLEFVGVNQDSAETTKRISHAYTIIALEGEKIVGTISYKPPWECRGTTWFNLPGVAKFNQLAVDPDQQVKGIARKLMDITEQIASEQGAKEIALDTAEGAEALIKYYNRRGYRFIDYHQWKFTNYRSVILSKSLLNVQTSG